MLEDALNVLENLVFVDRAKYEAPKEKRKAGRRAKAKEGLEMKVRNIHGYFGREDGQDQQRKVSGGLSIRDRERGGMPTDVSKL
jgi:hypothetical protein